MSAVDREPEAIVATMRPHGRTLVLPSILLVAAVGGTAYAVWILPEDWMRWSLLAAAAIVVVVGFALPVAMWAGRTVAITTRRTVVREGGLMRHRREVLHTRPIEVAVHRSLVQRLVGSGDVVLDLGYDRTLVLRDLPNPELVQAALADLMVAEQGEHAARRRSTGELEGRRGAAHAE